MKRVLFLAVALALLVAVANSMQGFEEKDLESEESLWYLYKRWKSQYSVSMDGIDVVESDKRFNVFKENVRFINDFNKQVEPYKLSLNQFADMTNQEFRSKYAGSRIEHHRMRRGQRLARVFTYENETNVPAAVDWRQKRAVTPVKNQGECGKCLHNFISNFEYRMHRRI